MEINERDMPARNFWPAWDSEPTRNRVEPPPERYKILY